MWEKTEKQHGLDNRDESKLCSCLDMETTAHLWLAPLDDVIWRYIPSSGFRNLTDVQLACVGTRVSQNRIISLKTFPAPLLVLLLYYFSMSCLWITSDMFPFTSWGQIQNKECMTLVLWMTKCVQMKVGVWEDDGEEKEKYSLHGYRIS